MPNIKPIPQEHIQKKVNGIISEVLGNRYRKVCVSELHIKEDLRNDLSYIECSISIGNDLFSISGEGRGLVDALFEAALSSLQKHFVSLENITLHDFVIMADTTKIYKKKSKTDATVEAAIFITNNQDGLFLFRHSCKSMISASVLCIVKVFEYYINSELAVVHLKACIENSKKRSRTDLTDRYVSLLSELVRNVSYENTINNIERLEMNDKETT